MKFLPRSHPGHRIWKWHRWFAWYPVYVPRIERKVWLEFVYRRRIRSGPILGDCCVYEQDMAGVLLWDAEREQGEVTLPASTPIICVTPAQGTATTRRAIS